MKCAVIFIRLAIFAKFLLKSWLFLENAISCFLSCSTLWSWDQSLQWRHNELAGVSKHQPHGCLLNRLFRRRSKKTSKLRVTGLFEGSSPVTGEFPAQSASNAENVSILWRHHGWFVYLMIQDSSLVILSTSGQSSIQHIDDIGFHEVWQQNQSQVMRLFNCRYTPPKKSFRSLAPVPITR